MRSNFLFPLGAFSEKDNKLFNKNVAQFITPDENKISELYLPSIKLSGFFSPRVIKFEVQQVKKKETCK